MMRSNLQKGIFILLALFSTQLFATAAQNTSTSKPLQNTSTCNHFLPTLTCNRFLNSSICHHLYVGGMLGAASLMDRESTNIPVHDEHYLSALGAIGGILGGYNFQLQKQWRLGLEGFINASSINISDDQNYTPQTSYTVNMRYNFGVRLLPTYEFTPTTAGHVVLGYSNAGFKINDDGNYGLINKTFSKSGFQTGLGIETCVVRPVSLRGDVLYTFYTSQSSNGVTTTSPSTIQAYNNKLSTLEAELSIIYNI